MSKLRGRLRNPARVLLILVAFIVVVAIVIDRDADEFTLQTAIGQTNDTLQTSEDFQHLERANQAFIDLVARTRPTVVQITTRTQRDRRDTSQRQQMSPEDEERFRDLFRRHNESPFRFFFGEPPIPRDLNPNPEPATGIGSGVIVSDDGYILTNNHVIEGADEIKVTLADGREYIAELIGRDGVENEGGGSDLAVIKIDAENLPILPFGDSNALEVGEWVIAIGTPLKYSQTVTRGIVSAKDRGFPIYGQFIQTDAPINRGNSGGALINIRGELVGINTLIATGGYSMGNIGIGFAIPSNLAQQILPQLIKDGKVVRGWLGIGMAPVTPELAEKLNFDAPKGALVTRVGMKSPAQKAGIQRGDVILSFDGEQIRDIHHLMNVVGVTQVGKSVEVIVLRNGDKEKRLTVKLGKRTAENLATLKDVAVDDVAINDNRFAGMVVRELTPAIAERYGYFSHEKGVVVTQIEEGSNAERKGIRPGYLIQEIEWIPVDDLETYTALVRNLKEKKKEKILLYVKSPDGWGRYITVKVSTSDR